MQRRKLEKWEEGAPPLKTVHVWPNPGTHLSSVFIVIFSTVMFFYWFDQQVFMLLNGEISSWSDFGLSWKREDQSWIMVISILFFWICGLFLFFKTPAHISIGSKGMRFTHWLGVEKHYGFGEIERLEWISVKGTSLLGLKLVNRQMRLVVNLDWSGVGGFIRVLKEQRPDLFPESRNE